MQKIYLEKVVDLNHQLQELIALSVDESINYKIENEGIRAIGNLIIKGEYRNVDKHTFEEVLELDVLATFDKILDQRDFSIKIEDFDYKIKDGNVYVTIEAGVHGVISGEDRYVEEENPLEDIEKLIREDQTKEDIAVSTNETPASVLEEEEMEKPVAVVKETKPVAIVEQTKPAEPVVANVGTIDDNIETVAKDIDEQLQEVVYESKTRPIFQDTTDSVGTYYLYIVQESDTYQSIAERYGNDPYAIQDYNQNRELEVGSVLIIPYAP